MVSSNSAAAAAAAAVVSKCQARKKRKKKRDPRKAEAQFSPSRLDWTTIVRTVALAVNSSSTVTEKLPSIIRRGRGRGRRQKNGERRANRRTKTDDKESAAANGKWKMGMQTDNGEGGQRRQVGRFNFSPALSPFL